MNSNPQFFRGLDLSFNKLFKESCLKKLYLGKYKSYRYNEGVANINKELKSPHMRYLTFLSLEKTGITDLTILSNFLDVVFYRCPDLEILILNYLGITDKTLDQLTKAIQQAATGPQKLVKNLKEIGLGNSKINDKSA